MKTIKGLIPSEAVQCTISGFFASANSSIYRKLLRKKTSTVFNNESCCSYLAKLQKFSLHLE